jgi:hypothetical protein
MISILEMERDNNDGVVRVYWEASKTVGDNTATVTGGFEFTPDPNNQNFVAFSDLTESTVIGWFTDEQNTHIQRALDIKIEEQSKPQVTNGLPW